MNHMPESGKYFLQSESLTERSPGTHRFEQQSCRRILQHIFQDHPFLIIVTIRDHDIQNIAVRRQNLRYSLHDIQKT